MQKITPFHERLDPESTFYKHYMQKVYNERLIEQANVRAKEDSTILREIARKLGPKKEQEEVKELDMALLVEEVKSQKTMKSHRSAKSARSAKSSRRSSILKN